MPLANICADNLIIHMPNGRQWRQPCAPRGKFDSLSASEERIGFPHFDIAEGPKLVDNLYEISDIVRNVFFEKDGPETPNVGYAYTKAKISGVNFQPVFANFFQDLATSRLTHLELTKCKNLARKNY